MFEIRIHGRGGQGVVTAAELLSVAAFHDGAQAQAFPSFGSERAGAPVVAFCRLDEHPIRVREPIAEPDALIVIDPTLLHQVDVFGGLTAGGFILINSSRSFADLGLESLGSRTVPERIRTVPATEVARELLGRPLPNAALLGGFAALTGRVSLGSITRAIHERFPGDAGAGNAAAAERTYALVRESLENPHAGPHAQLMAGPAELLHG